MQGGSTAADAPNETTWRKLIGPALAVIDSLHAQGYGRLDFRLGGGTVLMFRFGHRISKDIDVFFYDAQFYDAQFYDAQFYDAQALSFIMPRLNDVSERLSIVCEEQSNAVKLCCPRATSASS